VPRITAEAHNALLHYAFPGNVRELENILERAIALSGSGIVDVADLQLRQIAAVPAAAAATAEDAAATANVCATDLASPVAGSAVAPLGDQLESIERHAIVRALEQTRYNKTAAAKLLGMSFRALRYRVKKLGIE
jgi:two-component system response regulator PilR (NtrC family)